MVCNSDCVSMYGDGTAAAMNCSAACFEKSSYSEIPKIQALFKDCATPESTQTPDASAEQACTEAVIGCFQGSGDKSCGAIVDCVVDCCADVPDKCDGEDKCSTACMLGASSDFGKGFKGVMPCWDDEAAVQVNPFPCLAGMAECYKVTKEDEGKQCISIMADLKTAYDSTTLSVEALISTMTNVVKGANAQEAVDLVEALGCLAGKEGKDTTFGNVGLAGWTTCTAKCKSQPVPL